MDFDLYKFVDKYKLSSTEQNILQFILDHPKQSFDLNVRDLAKINYTSPATIIRLAQKLGYRGYTDMLYRIYFSVKSKRHDLASEKPHSIVNTDCFLESVGSQDIESFVQLMRSVGKAPIYTSGVGFSQTAAQYIARKLLVLGYPAIMTDSFELFENNRLGAKVSFLVSRSGETYEIVKYAKLASTHGLAVISFTGDQPNTLAEHSSINFKIEDQDKFDDRNMNVNYFYPSVVALFEFLTSKL
jgi:DNA-binding MurR/RpiR family transcriptional regulator